MKYLIVQEWLSTRGNHTGMNHMCDMLVELYPEEFVKIRNACPPRNIKGSSVVRKLYRHLYLTYYRIVSKITYIKLFRPYISKIKKGDEVYLLEYNFNEVAQYEFGCYLKKKKPDIRIYALSHMTSSLLGLLKREKSILKHDEIVDVELTLGTSLTSFFEKIGIKPSKISTGFHYVDSFYYKKDPTTIKEDDYLTILMMGGMLRNYVLLSEIVKRTPEVNWVICRGRNESVDSYFYDCKNVSLKGYLSEIDLKGLMDMANVSINVMEDTVGSNVITTSMSMGMAMIVSDVGSIRDYCDDSNAVFCSNTVESFVDAIDKLSLDKKRVKEMRLSSIRKSESFEIGYVKDWFNSLKGVNE